MNNFYHRVGDGPKMSNWTILLFIQTKWNPGPLDSSVWECVDAKETFVFLLLHVSFFGEE